MRPFDSLDLMVVCTASILATWAATKALNELRKPRKWKEEVTERMSERELNEHFQEIRAPR